MEPNHAEALFIPLKDVMENLTELMKSTSDLDSYRTMIAAGSKIERDLMSTGDDDLGEPLRDRDSPLFQHFSAFFDQLNIVLNKQMKEIAQQPDSEKKQALVSNIENLNTALKGLINRMVEIKELQAVNSKDDAMILNANAMMLFLLNKLESTFTRMNSLTSPTAAPAPAEEKPTQAAEPAVEKTPTWEVDKNNLVTRDRDIAQQAIALQALMLALRNQIDGFTKLSSKERLNAHRVISEQLSDFSSKLETFRQNSQQVQSDIGSFQDRMNDKGVDPTINLEYSASLIKNHKRSVAAIDDTAKSHVQLSDAFEKSQKLSRSLSSVALHGVFSAMKSFKEKVQGKSPDAKTDTPSSPKGPKP